MTKRTLEKWRREALGNGGAPQWAEGVREDQFKRILEMNSKILVLTRELIDIELLKGEKKK